MQNPAHVADQEAHRQRTAHGTLRQLSHLQGGKAFKSHDIVVTYLDISSSAVPYQLLEKTLSCHIK